MAVLNVTAMWPQCNTTILFGIDTCIACRNKTYRKKKMEICFWWKPLTFTGSILLLWTVYCFSCNAKKKENKHFINKLLSDYCSAGYFFLLSYFIWKSVIFASSYCRFRWIDLRYESHKIDQEHRQSIIHIGACLLIDCSTQLSFCTLNVHISIEVTISHTTLRLYLPTAEFNEYETPKFSISKWLSCF